MTLATAEMKPLHTLDAPSPTQQLLKSFIFSRGVCKIPGIRTLPSTDVVVRIFKDESSVAIRVLGVDEASFTEIGYCKTFIDPTTLVDISCDGEGNFTLLGSLFVQLSCN